MEESDALGTKASENGIGSGGNGNDDDVEAGSFSSMDDISTEG